MKAEAVTECKLCNSTDIAEIDPDCNIAKCRACGYIFHNLRPANEELVEFYSKPTQYDSWLVALPGRDDLWKRRLRKLRRQKRAGTLLDVGTGIGQFLAVARNSYSEVYGTEISRTALRIAKELYGLDLYEGDIESLSARGMSFDNVTLFHVLEHVPNPRSVLETCRSLLSEDGILSIAVPNEISSLRAFLRRTLIKMRLKKGIGILGLHPISLESSEVHLSYFTPSVLSQALKDSGFADVTTTLDPFYVAAGVAKLKADLYYSFCSAILRLFKINLYDAVLVTGRKSSKTSGR